MRNYKYGNRSMTVISSVAAPLQDICFRAQKIANKANSKIHIPDWGYSSGYRTAEEQAKLFLDGSSPFDGVTRLSKHQECLAIDLYAYVNGQASYEPSDINPIILCHMQAASDLKIKINWGGLFSSIYDSPHVELGL